jgi:hypothetical protein
VSFDLNSRKRTQKQGTGLLTLGNNDTVLVQQQHKVRDLSSDGGHVVGVVVILDGLVDGKVLVDKDSGDEHENQRQSHGSLLKDLEDDDQRRGSGVDSGTDQDQTDKDTNHGVGDGGKTIGHDSNLEHSHALSKLVHGLFRLLPLNKNPSDGDGGVDHAHNGDGLEDTGSQGGTSKATSSLFHDSNALLVDGFFIAHLHK